jgi:hypothetical protein
LSRAPPAAADLLFLPPPDVCFFAPPSHTTQHTQQQIAPWSKTGGLADVLGSLPIALASRGHRVMVVAPRYEDYEGAVAEKARAVCCAVLLVRAAAAAADAGPSLCCCGVGRGAGRAFSAQLAARRRATKHMRALDRTQQTLTHQPPPTTHTKKNQTKRNKTNRRSASTATT